MIATGMANFRNRMRYFFKGFDAWDSRKQANLPSLTVSIDSITLWTCVGRQVQHELIIWGISSVGRALEWHSRGRGFDSLILH